MENMLYSDKEFNRIFEKIYNKENFSFLRYGDGEKRFLNEEHHIFEKNPINDSNFRKELFESLKLEDEKILYGIPSTLTPFTSVLNFYFNMHIKSKNITFAELFVNKNYQYFKKYFEKIEEDVVLIANYRAKGKKIGNLNILKHYEISDDLDDFYKNEFDKMIENIKNDFGNKENLLFVISAGPLAELIIYRLFLSNPNNRYIDFGSALSSAYYQKTGRTYLKRKVIKKLPKVVSMPCKQECENTDISVVLNLYKRPHALTNQLKAIQAQSLKPREIILYQDGVFEGIEIPKNIKNEFDLIEISKENKGVWARFDFAKRKANSKFVCVFDDDIIPGCDFLANCFVQMQKKEGCYGACGTILNVPEDHHVHNGMFRIGCATPNEESVEVDYVGHSWFFKKEWLDDFFTDTISLQKYKLAGENMGWSLSLQKKGIKIFVPPHPKNEKAMWGTDRKLGQIYGKKGISSLKSNVDRFDEVMREVLKLGFKPMIETDKVLHAKLRKKYGKTKPLWVKNFMYPFRQPRKAFKRMLGLNK
ncbi:glycosyltransferase family 2 protein [Campylobacter sp. LR185c]|uniref:glycosyltransferase family A protein n=1 Tax=Campylobacter sp. LR185c TaxID=2014525 RepID=UPI001237D3FE|nr:glycosyltransferase family A protein [Campylobacter sp. LR185c]KAA6220582.1 glycosyltransferase family 2 protein [Campylobacter sp. LR185c]KAA8604246.1 hypothetical protein CGP82_03395 [Campylobacter sp. LR185c]